MSRWLRSILVKGSLRRWSVGDSMARQLTAYTVAPARAAGAGQRRGRLAPGWDADLVAWSIDPTAELDDGAAFRQARVVLTVVGGTVVMQG